MGEITRRQLRRTGNDRYVWIKDGPFDREIPNVSEACTHDGRITGVSSGESTPYRCERLFVVDQLGPLGRFGGGENAPYSSLLEVSYKSTSYATPDLADENGKPNISPNENEKAGRTFQVLAMVRQLIGMQRLAKDLPVSNVYTLISP